MPVRTPVSPGRRPGADSQRRPCASLASGSTLTSRRRDMSSVKPRSAIEVPAMLWPPPLMLSNKPWSRANPTAAATSVAEVGWRTSAGTFATMPFQTSTASSQPASTERSTGHLTRESSSSSCSDVSLTRPPSSPATSMVLAFMRCPSAIQLYATPFTETRLAGFGQLSGHSPSWPKTAGTLDAGCDDEQHRRGLRELLPAEREP